MPQPNTSKRRTLRQLKEKKPPTLLDREATGGDTSEGGSVFQANVVISCVCRWLADDSFSELTRESLADVEAKFFVPGRADFELELVEAKNHNIEPAEFWAEIDRFIELDSSHPGTYRSFILACPVVSDGIKRIVNGLERVRKPSSFYGSKSSVLSQSYNDFVELVKKQKKDEKVAQFLFDRVWIIFDLGGQSQWNNLLESIKNYLPDYRNLNVGELDAIYVTLKDFLHTRRNQPFRRIEIEEKFREKIEISHLPAPRPINLQIKSEVTKGLSFDWSEFSGDTQFIPSPERWDEKVLGELKQTRNWILRERAERRVRVDGMTRMPTAFAIGAIFSATWGFAIDVAHRDTIFSTADTIVPKDDNASLESYQWQISNIEGNEDAGRLVVSIGISTDIRRDVENYSRQVLPLSPPMLHLYQTEPLTSARQAGIAVAEAKRIIKERLSGTKLNHIDLFLAGPSWFAVFLGYRSSSLPQIQTYFYSSNTRQYFPACLIPAR